MLDRPKPLSVKTRLRIGRGAQKFWGPLAPLYIRLLDLPADEERTYIERCDDGPIRSFLLSRNGHNDPGGRVRPADDPLATVTGSGSGTDYLVSPAAQPFLAVYQQNAAPKSLTEPIGTLLTEDHVSLVSPVAQPFVFANRQNNVPVGPNQPIPTLTTATGGGAYVVSPGAEPVVMGQQSDSAARAVREPIMTIATGGVIRVATPTAAPFLDLYYQTGAADSVDDPLSTTTTKPRHALVSPLAVPYGPRAEARSGDEPLHAILTKDRLGVATPIASVITPGFGENLGKGQLPRVHDLDDPAPAIAATGHLHLATATVAQIEAVTAGIDPRRLAFIDGVLHVLDIRFRMLKNAELAAAMGFPPDYQFTGTKSDITKQIGNAVPVHLAEALVAAILDPEDVKTRRLAS